MPCLEFRGSNGPYVKEMKRKERHYLHLNTARGANSASVSFKTQSSSNHTPLRVRGMRNTSWKRHPASLKTLINLTKASPLHYFALYEQLADRFANEL
jgi:hypothetical protein